DRNMPRSVRAPPSLRQRAERNLTLARERRNRDTAAVRVVNRAVHVPVHQNLNSLEIHRLRGTSPEHALPRCADHARVALSLDASRLRRDRTPNRGSAPCAVRLLPDRHRQVPIPIIDREKAVINGRVSKLRSPLYPLQATVDIDNLTGKLTSLRVSHYNPLGSRNNRHRGRGLVLHRAGNLSDADPMVQLGPCGEWPRDIDSVSGVKEIKRSLRRVNHLKIANLTFIREGIKDSSGSISSTGLGADRLIRLDMDSTKPLRCG